MTENDAGTPHDARPETPPTQPLPEPSPSAEQQPTSGTQHEPAPSEPTHPGAGAPYGRPGAETPYGPPGAGAMPQYVYAPAPPKNDLAIWSLITGILSFVMCPLLLGVAAIVTGTMSRKAADEGLADNRGMGTAGLILGWVNVGMTVLGIIFFVVLLGVGLLAGGIGSMNDMNDMTY